MTEKRKAEAIVESISDGIIVTDMETVLFWSIRQQKSYWILKKKSC